ncbi:MAG: ATP-binding protein [Planctomycetes bacterium]|nr:ATP-binding protein [Planctomycetota bacterium]
MPELKLQTSQENLSGIAITRLRLAGFINSSTFQNFQKTLDVILQAPPKELVLDFREVQYINSTGMSTLANYRKAFLKAGTEMVIVHTSDPVYGIMSLIGLPDIIPIFSKEEPLVTYLRSGTVGKRRTDTSAAQPQPRWKPKGKAEPRGAEEIETLKPEESTVLMVVPKRDRFTEITRRRLETPKGRFEFAFDCRQALEMFDQITPDLVILEDQLEGSEDFLSTIKVQKSKSITPIIKIYYQGTDLNRRKQFKIWEDAYLIEPFEMVELFALSEAELRQIPKNRQILLHLTHYEFEGGGGQVEKAKELSQKLLAVSGLNKKKAATELHAAFSEAVDNAVLHGLKGDTSLHVDVVFLIDRDKITITVEDEGKGFDYQTHLKRVRENPAPAEERTSVGRGKTGGLGIHLMSRCTDQLEYLGAGNCVRLTKYIRPGAE